jgi:hypothetical protein
MKFELNKYRPGTLIIIATAVALSACGGGGGGGDSAAAPAAAPAPTVTATWAASGSYSPVLKLQGNASATPLSIALSLVHPSRPDVEYVLDTSASPMRLGLTLERGTYSSTTKQITGLTPAAFIDSPAGRVRSTSLQANGQRPLQALSAAVSLCDSSIVARNFAAPYSSQIAVDSPGADGICETPDDVQALVTFSSSGVPTAAVNVLGKMLGYFTSDITGEPLSWVMSSPTGQIVTLPIGPTGNALTFTVPPAIPLATKPVFKPVVNLNNLLVFSQDGGLRSLNASVNPPTLNNLSVLSGPDGWKSAGSDANHVYVYLNSATAASGTGTWSIFAISRTSQALTTIATGFGSIFAAETAAPRIFVTLISGLSASVIQIATAGGAQTPFIAPSTTSTSFVAASPNGFHLVATSNNAPVGSTSFSIIDNAGVAISATANGLVYGRDQRQYDTVSQIYTPTSFLSTQIQPGTVFSGSTLTNFDPVTRTSRLIGNFPTGTALGGLASDAVFVSPLMPHNGFGGTHAARIVSGQFLAGGSAVYTLDTGIANSLTRTTIQVR